MEQNPFSPPSGGNDSNQRFIRGKIYINSHQLVETLARSAATLASASGVSSPTKG